MEENIIGRDLRQSQVSHYDPKSNRCYVQLTVSHMTTPRDNYDIFLYDGQTRDMLASVSVEHGEKVGMVFVEVPSNPTEHHGASTTDHGFAEGREFIDRAMEDDRKE
jgi:hypothetical protein